MINTMINIMIMSKDDSIIASMTFGGRGKQAQRRQLARHRSPAAIGMTVTPPLTVASSCSLQAQAGRQAGRQVAHDEARRTARGVDILYMAAEGQSSHPIATSYAPQLVESSSEGGEVEGLIDVGRREQAKLGVGAPARLQRIQHRELPDAVHGQGAVHLRLAAQPPQEVR